MEFDQYDTISQYTDPYFTVKYVKSTDFDYFLLEAINCVPLCDFVSPFEDIYIINKNNLENIDSNYYILFRSNGHRARIVKGKEEFNYDPDYLYVNPNQYITKNNIIVIDLHHSNLKYIPSMEFLSSPFYELDNIRFYKTEESYTYLIPYDLNHNDQFIRYIDLSCPDLSSNCDVQFDGLDNFYVRRIETNEIFDGNIDSLSTGYTYEIYRKCIQANTNCIVEQEIQPNQATKFSYDNPIGITLLSNNARSAIMTKSEIFTREKFGEKILYYKTWDGNVNINHLYYNNPLQVKISQNNEVIVIKAMLDLQTLPVSQSFVFQNYADILAALGVEAIEQENISMNLNDERYLDAAIVFPKTNYRLSKSSLRKARSNIKMADLFGLPSESVREDPIEIEDKEPEPIEPTNTNLPNTESPSSLHNEESPSTAPEVPDGQGGGSNDWCDIGNCSYCWCGCFRSYLFEEETECRSRL